jgi:dihydroorotate dehydrogenase
MAAKEHPKEWTVGGITHIKVASTDKEANKALKEKGAIIEATYFNNKGVKTYVQYNYKKGKKE